VELQVDGRSWRFGQDRQVHIYHLLGLDTTDIIMRGQSNTKTTMMDALVKEAKDTVLEKILEGQNEEASPEEEQEIIDLVEKEVESSNDPDLKDKKAKPKKPTEKAKDKGKKKADSAVVDVPAKEKGKKADAAVDIPAKDSAVVDVPAKDKGKKKAESALVDVPAKEKGKKKKKADAAVDAPAKTGSSSKPSTEKAADVEASGSKAANAEASSSKGPTTTSSKPAFVDLDDSDPDVPLRATTRHVKHPKRKASDVDPDVDEQPPKQVKGKKGVERERPPPSKKAKTTSTKPPSRMEREGAAWKARQLAAAAVISATLAGASSSGTTVTTPSSIPRPPGTSHFSLGLSISHSNINVAASIPPPSQPSGTTAVPAKISTSVSAAVRPSGTIFPKPPAATSSVLLSSKRTMTTPPPAGPQTPSGSPMRVVEQQVPASPLPSQSAAHDDLMDFDQMGNESTWSAQANPGGCKSFPCSYFILFLIFVGSSTPTISLSSGVRVLFSTQGAFHPEAQNFTSPRRGRVDHNPACDATGGVSH